MTNPSLIARHVGDLALRVYAAPSYPATLRGTATPHRAGRATTHRGFCRPAPESPCRLPCAGATSRCRPRAATCARWTMATPTWLQVWRAWVCCVARLHGEAACGRGYLVPLFADWQMDPMPASSFYAPHRHVSAKLRVFIDWVAALMAEHAPLCMPKLLLNK